nr:hypothetical protein [bacterium]
MPTTIYLNLEDDVTKVADKIRRERGPEVVLVFPKQSFIFSDSINLRLLKKQIDLMGKKAHILTMDEKGQMYAQEAGFSLKHLAKTTRNNSTSDIRSQRRPVRPSIPPAPTLPAAPIPMAEPERAAISPVTRPVHRPVLAPTAPVAAARPQKPTIVTSVRQHSPTPQPVSTQAPVI